MKIDETPRRVHFVGIGGVGMSGLAQHLHLHGCLVSGSDRTASDRTAALQKLGIQIHIGHDAANVGNAALVVRTSAVPISNVEVAHAISHNVPVILREQLLGAIFNSFERRIAICGTHGKTTVTAMVHEILAQANVSHTALIGGVYHGNNYYHGSGTVVAEACEFNRSFYNLTPTVCVCLNAEFDHPDCYKDEQDTQNAFHRFMCNTCKGGTVILPSELSHLCPERRSVLFDKRYKVKNLTHIDGKAQFDVTFRSKRTYHFALGAMGKHNVNNALAAIAVAEVLGVPMDAVQKALSIFDGVDRRWTEFNKPNLCRTVIDYAHHPTEIECSVATAKSIAKGKVVCVFQPHTYSRTKAFWSDFTTCFAKADKVAYLPIYSAREQPLPEIDSQRLAQAAADNGIDACYVDSFDAARKWILDTVSSDDVLLILGAGDIFQIAELL